MPKKIELQHLSLTPAAAQYMDKQKLVMRNSFTKQVESLHYKLKSHPESHTPGRGMYCTPLWTIAKPKLLEDIKAKTLQLTAHLHPDSWSAEYASQDIALLPEATAYLDDFLKKIRQSIQAYTVLGYEFRNFYDYELLIGTQRWINIDDIGRYPTGGRSHLSFNKDSIVYRATFNEVDIQFFKEILAGNFDKELFPSNIDMTDKSEVVVKSIRGLICNRLATEVICAKLTIFLNACGQLKQVIAFSKSDLKALLTNVLSRSQADRQEWLANNAVTCEARDHYAEFMEAIKYTQNRPTHSLHAVVEMAACAEVPAPTTPAAQQLQRQAHHVQAQAKMKAAQRCREMLTKFGPKTDAHHESQQADERCAFR